MKLLGQWNYMLNETLLKCYFKECLLYEYLVIIINFVISILKEWLIGSKFCHKYEQLVNYMIWISKSNFAKL